MMNMKYAQTVLALLAIAGLANAEGEFGLTGNVQTQATKALYDNDTDENLSSFFFRSNFGGKYTSDDFDGEVNIRMYATKFGNVSGQDRFQADTYYGNYKWALSSSKLNLKLGHWKTDYSRGGNFGSYVDQLVSKRGFLARDYSHDAFELGWQAGPSTLTAMLATSDAKFNTGYVKVEDKLKIADPFEVNLGYRVNAIDPIQYTAVMTHRMDLRANFEVMPKFSVYGEVAAIITGKDDAVNDSSISEGTAVKPEYKQDTNYFPFYVGLEIPTAGIFDKAFVEVEYVKDRDELNADADNAAWTVGIVKKIGSRTKAQVSAYSEKEISDVALAARISTTIK
ncbi:MAG: hypothetical protein M0P13_01035 [Fibrobacteraceae bacterium]|nr:hypothetical protein [Fibrobacteraceae bacterium]